jgi:hypothetical protein
MLDEMLRKMGVSGGRRGIGQRRDGWCQCGPLFRAASMGLKFHAWPMDSRR